MYKKLLTTFVLIIVLSCSSNYENEYVADYYLDFNKFPSTTTKVFKDINSGGYFFYNIGMFLEGKDTIISQVSFDKEFKYDSIINVVKNKAINQKEAYSFSLDSMQTITEVDIQKHPDDVQNLKDKRAYKVNIKLNEDELLQTNSVLSFKGFDSIRIKNKMHYCAVIVSYGVVKINDEMIGNPTDTIYLKKYFGMLKMYQDLYDEPKEYILDTIIDTRDFNIENYR